MRTRERLELISCPLYRPDEFDFAPSDPEWLWDGYLACGQITLLTGQWKIGKTALLACLLGRLGTGGLLAGCSVRPANAIVLTEEGMSLWRSRCRDFRIGSHVSFAFRPFSRKVDVGQWEMMADSIRIIQRERAVELLVIDPLATIWPVQDENHAAGVVKLLSTIRTLAAQNLAVLLVHHPRKERIGGGRESRGSGALSAFVDILIEMRWYAKAESTDRRRRLLAWSRYDRTPRELIISMTADGKNFVPDDGEDGPGPVDLVVLRLLRDEPGLSFREILRLWPRDTPRPSPTALHRCLSRLLDEGRLSRRGSGSRYSPFRYQVEAAS